jgi:hypothetical protein
MSCSGLFLGAQVSCTDPLVSAVEQRIFIANLKDFTYTSNVTETNQVDTITMATGKYFWEFEGIKQSISCQAEKVPQNFSSAYKHTVDFSVFDVSAQQRRNLEAMSYQPMAAIVYGPNDSSLGNAAFEIYGLNTGLDVATLIRINADNETGGAYRVQLASPDSGGIEPHLPFTFFDTDYATTLAAVLALKSA